MVDSAASRKVVILLGYESGEVVAYRRGYPHQRWTIPSNATERDFRSLLGVLPSPNIQVHLEIDVGAIPGGGQRIAFVAERALRRAGYRSIVLSISEPSLPTSLPGAQGTPAKRRSHRGAVLLLRRTPQGATVAIEGRTQRAWKLRSKENAGTYRSIIAALPPFAKREGVVLVAVNKPPINILVSLMDTLRRSGFARIMVSSR